MTASKIVAAAASGAGGDPLDIDNVFNTYLWDGDSSSGNEITGIDTLNEGGLVWLKHRLGSNSFGHAFYDTERGHTKQLRGDNTSAESTESRFTGFLDNGFSLSGDTELDYNNNSYVAWTFRKAKNFFDVVTYSGNGSHGRTVSHNLGSVPGMILIKRRNSADDWRVFHRSQPNKYAALNSTGAFGTDGGNIFGDPGDGTATAPTSTNFTVANDNSVNGSGSTYVAYLFAHHNNNGTFGPDGDQDVIKFGTATTPSSAADFEINLGFEPQFVMFKLVGGGGWMIHDSMRSLHHDNSSQPQLFANQAYHEAQITANNHIEPIATGFRLTENAVNQSLGANAPFIYMAIRRGPLAVPEDPTKVFFQSTASAGTALSVGFVPDFWLGKNRSNGASMVMDRLRHQKYMSTNSNAAEQNTNDPLTGAATNTFTNNASGGSRIEWLWKRAPSYFDVVAYTGTGSARTVSHNLGVVPEMMWIKMRSNTQNWAVYHKGLNGGTDPEDYALGLNDTSANFNTATYFNDTAPTASVFTVANGNPVNGSGENYIAYLFATVEGVSKVGSYTGSSSAVNVDCGFTSGARFILIKRSSASGDGWFTFDSVRGIVAGNDPFLYLNDTQGEFTSYDAIDPYSAGFTVTTALAGLNTNGSTYIFYAIA